MTFPATLTKCTRRFILADDGKKDAFQCRLWLCKNVNLTVLWWYYRQVPKNAAGERKAGRSLPPSRYSTRYRIWKVAQHALVSFIKVTSCCNFYFTKLPLNLPCWARFLCGDSDYLWASVWFSEIISVSVLNWLN